MSSQHSTCQDNSNQRCTCAIHGATAMIVPVWYYTTGMICTSVHAVDTASYDMDIRNAVHVLLTCARSQVLQVAPHAYMAVSKLHRQGTRSLRHLDACTTQQCYSSSQHL